jgi:hypothetical protein
MNMMLKSTTAIALLGAGNIEAGAIPPADHPDAELISLASAAIDLNRRSDEACAKADGLLEVLYDRQPERPAELRARPTDGDIKHIGFERDERSDPEHRNKCWISVDDVEALRTTQQTKGQASWEFIGSDADWDELERIRGGEERWEQDGDGGYQPPAQQRHLWEKQFHPGKQARADEILRAYDRHDAEVERVRVELGLDVAETRENELYDQLVRLERKIEKMRAVTIDGIRAKANVVGHVCWSGKIIRREQTTDRRILASIMSDLTGLPDDRLYDPEGDQV